MKLDKVELKKPINFIVFFLLIFKAIFVVVFVKKTIINGENSPPQKNKAGAQSLNGKAIADDFKSRNLSSSDSFFVVIHPFGGNTVETS